MGEGADWVMEVWFDERSRSVVMKTLSEGWDRQLYNVIKRVVFQIESPGISIIPLKGAI